MNTDKINLDAELKKLKESIDAVTHGWFYKQQTALGITDGDMGFDLTFAYENALDKFVDICKQGLEFQYECAQYKEVPITYQVDKYGGCSFFVDGIEFEVQILRNVHKDKEDMFRHIGIATLVCYHDEDEMYFHQVPNGWVRFEDFSEFDDGKLVHDFLLRAAKAYVKEVWGFGDEKD